MRDLLVAGGGPVGLAVAIRARLCGLSVTVFEPRQTPVDKACGEGLMPTAVARLLALGVDPPGRAFRGIRYVDGPRAVSADFRRGSGRGVRRTTLHGALAARAQALGAEVVGVRVDDLRQGPGYVTAGGLRGRWLVAADGLHSPVRRQLGLDRTTASPRGARFGQRRHYRVAPWGEHVEVHWSATAEAYVTPVADDLVGVAVLCGPGLRYAEAMDGFPGLRERLAAAEAVTPVRGGGPLRQVAGARVAGRVLLVGDAAGYVDALTGEGLAIGLAGAEAAVRAVLSGRPEEYERAWRQATRRYRLLTGALLVAAQRPALRRRIVPAAQRLPGVFAAAVDALA